jgi:hypothetical protein
LCRRLDLADGNDKEVFSSKYKYARKRLVERSAERVVASACQPVAEEEHFEVTDRLVRMEELKGPRVTALTRRRPMALFENLPIAPGIDEIELTRGRRPIGCKSAPWRNTSFTKPL